MDARSNRVEQDDGIHGIPRGDYAELKAVEQEGLSAIRGPCRHPCMPQNLSGGRVEDAEVGRAIVAELGGEDLTAAFDRCLIETAARRDIDRRICSQVRPREKLSGK